VYTYYNHDVNINEFYDGKDYSVRDTRNSIFFKIQKSEYSSVIKSLQKITGLKSPKVLDFGSGKGLFLHFAELQGCDVKGIESSKPRAQYAREHFTLDINSENYSSGSVFDTTFDVLTLFHVLEHLKNPSDLLGNLVRANLKTGGLLIAEVPNFGSWQSRLAGDKWLHLDVPRHLNHFTDVSFEKLLNKVGCSIIKKEYFSIHLGIVGMVQTIFSWFGYKGFLIAELKENNNWILLAKVILTVPLAVLLESVAVIFKKGGIIRYYAIYDAGKKEQAHYPNPA
jgi:SAM-dependent methyltransferase